MNAHDLISCLLGEEKSSRCPHKRAMTVLELLVVMAVITVLAALLLPAVQAAREAARNVECQDHLRQIGLALHAHHDRHRALPAGWHANADGETAFGWAPYLLPELEETSLFTLINFQSPKDSPTRIIETTPAMFICPSDFAEPRFNLYKELGTDGEFGQDSQNLLVELPEANYVGVFGVSDPDTAKDGFGEGPFIKNIPCRFPQITRGLGKVMFIGERTARKLPSTWIGIYLSGEDANSRLVGSADRGPNQLDADESELESRHAGHVNFLWGDGHVQAVADDVDRTVYQDAARRDE
jgi:prepilin-type processing-associated H-X9-DG protein/prepilin-type N-terminal cleavage/methylation domain-containing protein